MGKVRIVAWWVAACAVGAAAVGASCAATPTTVPFRTFQQAQKMDVVCIAVNASDGTPLPTPLAGVEAPKLRPLVQSECQPVPPNANGALLPNHLFAVVTQTTRGELAVVDLTAGGVVDVDRATPGINFIPVGANPTDVAVTPDGQMTFVSSADPSKPAIYGVPNERLLGDSTGVPSFSPLRLPDLPACALPQPPQALAIAPNGVADGGPPKGYVLVAMLRASAGMPARIVAIDPTSLLRGGGSDAGISNLAPVAPGSLAPCPVLGAHEFSAVLPSSWSPGPAWPDGVPYVDAGNLGDTEPSSQFACQVLSSDGGPDAGDGGLPLSSGSLDAPHPTSMAARGDLPILYVGDDAQPMIHVIDLATPTAPRELPPLLATRLSRSVRRVGVGGIAVSPPTKDYRRYLYAIDANDGSLMVFDVTDPRPTAPTSPLVRPHSELNPFAPPDRISFSAPVATVAFVQHDWPLVLPNDPEHAYQGLLCNPNPAAFPSPQAGPRDLGAYYRVDQAGTIQSQASVQNFPGRLRGIFAFATLANGTIVTIDVDDWDAPCRRPDPMQIGGAGIGAGMTGALDLPEPAPAPGEFPNPYHAPTAYRSAFPVNPVTQEAFFPVSAPNRARSNFLLRNDPTSGVHVPNVLGAPLLFDANGAPVATSGKTGGSQPLILPTPLSAGFIDLSYIKNPTEPNPLSFEATSPALESAAAQLVRGSLAPALLPGANSVPGVRLSFDDPTVHVDQDWTVTYEGVLPGTNGLVADLASTDDYNTLAMSSKGANFCDRGIEDWSLGRSYAGEVLAEAERLVLIAPSNPAERRAQLDKWTADYVEIIDDLLPQDDPYWSQKDGSDSCWAGVTTGDGIKLDAVDAPGIANKRYNACEQDFGAASDADTHLLRDFPILRAYDGELVVGRFFYPSQGRQQTTSRVIVGSDPSNATALRFATCCFHRQAAFKVRAGGEWVTVGQNGLGLLHHVVGAPAGAPAPYRACVRSCDPHDALLNARTIDVPWSRPGSCDPLPMVPPFERNSPLAMRNPFFSFVMWSGCGKLARPEDHTLDARDLVWKFSVRGGFSPLTVSLAGTTGAAVVPQSMRFIDSLGQIAVVDGAQQGLVLIDLNTLAFAHAPYF